VVTGKPDAVLAVAEQIEDFQTLSRGIVRFMALQAQRLEEGCPG